MEVVLHSLNIICEFPTINASNAHLDICSIQNKITTEERCAKD